MVLKKNHFICAIWKLKCNDCYTIIYCELWSFGARRKLSKDFLWICFFQSLSICHHIREGLQKTQICVVKVCQGKLAKRHHFYSYKNMTIKNLITTCYLWCWTLFKNLCSVFSFIGKEQSVAIVERIWYKVICFSFSGECHWTYCILC
jgi:hypothetical protein